MTKYFALITLILLSSYKPVQAQNTSGMDTLKQLDEAIVTYQAGILTPVTYQNISLKDLDEKSIGQEPSFLLSETPSITNYSDAGSTQGYSYYRLRGIDQTRINITLDGVPLNEPEDQGVYFSNYPDILNSVSLIQIQRGVGTSKNGVASFAGNIQLLSPDLSDSAKTNLGLGYGSFNSFRAFGEYNSGISNRKAFYVRASQIYSDGYKYNSANNSQSVFFSGGLFYGRSAWKLNVLAGQQRNQLAWAGVSDSLIDRDRRINANTREEDDRFIQYLVQLQNTWQISPSSLLKSSVYYTFLKGDFDFDLNRFLGKPSTSELYNYAFQSNLIGFFTNYTFLRKSFTWITGVHANAYNRKHNGSERTSGPLYHNTGYKQEASSFTKANYSFRKFTFFADIQYRYVSFGYKGPVTLGRMQWHFVNPKAGLSIAMKPNAIVYYSLGQTGREPTRNDMFGGNDDLLTDSLGNPALFITNPEYVLDHELGFRYLQKKLQVNLNLYYMNFRNEIVLDGKLGPNGLALTNNVERSFRTGIELGVLCKVSKHFSLVNNSSFNYSRIKEQTELFSPILTPPVIINQEVAYFHNNFSAAVSMRYQSGSYIDFANTTTVSSYFLLNCRVAYAIKGFLCALFLNNITNAKYFNNGYIDTDGSSKYFVQAPTHFYTTIQYSF